VRKARDPETAGSRGIVCQDEALHIRSRSGPRQTRVVPPEPVVGQARAAPPAIDRVVTAEIFLVGDDGFTELRQREPAPEIERKTRAQIFSANRAQLVIETCYRGPR